MDFQQINAIARGVQSEKGPEEAIKVYQVNWLAHPFTNEFLAYLEQERERFTRAAIKSAASGGENLQACKLAARVLTIENIINYARGTPNGKSNDNGNAGE